MDEIQYKKDTQFLFRFLKEKGVYPRYKRYIHNPSTFNTYQKTIKNWSFKKALEQYGVRYMITMLITWDRTPEGYDFWSNLHQEFNAMMKKVNPSQDEKLFVEV